MSRLKVYQSLWATEQRRPGIPERPFAERFDRVRDAGYDGMAIDCGALNFEEARSVVPEYARTGLAGFVIAFPRAIEDLRPAIHLAKDIGAPFVVVVGQVMPVAVADMIPVIEGWLKIAREEIMPLQFETHRNCITNDLHATLQLIDAIPEMRLCADLSHYVVDREMTFPISEDNHRWIGRILERSDSFQGRIATRNQVQVPIGFPQHEKWVDLFRGWWTQGFTHWRGRAAADEDLVFLCELGPPEYAITGADGAELSDRWQEALQLRDFAMECWQASAQAAA